VKTAQTLDRTHRRLVDRRMGKTPKKIGKMTQATPTPTSSTPRNDITLEDMQAALREHGTVAGAAESLNMSGPNFQQTWSRRARDAGVQQTPGEYLDSLGMRREPRGTSPAVFFRLPEYSQLEAAAKEEGTEPNEYAREVLRKHLARRAKRQA